MGQETRFGDRDRSPADRFVCRLQSEVSKCRDWRGEQPARPANLACLLPDLQPVPRILHAAQLGCARRGGTATDTA